jgi:hypothetical protein
VGMTEENVFGSDIEKRRGGVNDSLLKSNGFPQPLNIIKERKCIVQEGVWG